MNGTKLTEENLKKISKFSRKLANYYELFNWSWADEGIPTRQMIYESIVEKVQELERRPFSESISSGGITVEFDDDLLTISFSKSFELYL